MPPTASGSPAPAPPPASPAAPPSAPSAERSGSGSEGAADLSSRPAGAGGSAADAEAAAAGADPGQASLRYQLLRHVERDAIGIQYNNYFSGRQSRIRPPLPLPEGQAEAIRRAFVDPDGWADVRAAFAGRRLTILRGRAGCGKRGAAIRLLLPAQHGRIYQLDRRTPLSDLADMLAPGHDMWDSLGQSPGLLIDQPRDIASLRVDLLQGLEALLEKADARLVLTVGSDVTFPTHDLRDYGFVLDLPGPPAGKLLVARYLEYQFGEERAAQLMALPGIQKVISKHTGTETSCSFAVALTGIIADRCADAVDADSVPLQKIANDIERHRAGHFESWFSSLPDAQSRAFAIALAVFGGLPYEFVARAARALNERFDDAPPYLAISSDMWYPSRGPRVSKLRPGITTRRERLEILGAHVKAGDASGSYGISQAELVEYDDSSYSSKVLRYAWTAYEMQDILIDWLCSLADNEAVQIQLLTARALGLLATWSFDYLGSRVLAQWAASKRRGRRQAVAYALWKAVTEEPRLLPNARNLIKTWYADRSRPSAQATAARAYGLVLGAVDLAEALEALSRLLIVDSSAVAVAIGTAMADLVAPATLDSTGAPLPDEEADVVRRVLTAFEGAMGDRNRSDQAELAFLTMANLLLTPVPSAATGQLMLWPSLLRLLIRLPDIRPSVVKLWQHVLSDSPYPDLAGQIMTQWAAIAEYEPEAREVFLRLARAICRDHARCRLIMERFAAEWVSPQNLQPLYTLSAALQSVVAAESEVL
jgi:hypothetical protein